VRKIFAFVLSEWLYVVRDRTALLMLVFMPIIFTVFLGLVFGGAGNAPSRLGVIAGNASMTESMREALSKDKGITYLLMTLDEAQMAIRRGTLDAAITIPAGDLPAEGIKIITDSTTQRGYDAYVRVMGLQSAVSGRATAIALGKALLPPGADIASAGTRYNTASLPEVHLSRTWRNVAEGVLQVSPGMLVMFIMMFAAYSGEGIVQERANGTLRRLLAAPVSGWHYVSGRLLGKVTIGMFQFLILAGFGALVFKVNWGAAPSMMLLTGLIFSISSAAFGLFLGVICRTPDQLSATATISCLAMAALGGTWWPIEAAPDLLQKIGRFLPTGQAMKAFQALILSGKDGVAEAHAAWAGLAAWGILFLVLGVLFFRRTWQPTASSRGCYSSSLRT
jgi:ABC-2 type transport system permease protein